MLIIAALLLFILTCAGFLKWAWWFTILDFFRLQYACAAILVFILSLWFFNPLALCLCGVITFINLYRVRHFLPRFSSGKIYQNKDILSINAHKENIALDKLKSLIEGADAHIVLIMEMTDEIETALGSTLNHYPYRLEHPVRDGFRICLLSKAEMTEPNISFHGPGDTPLLQADITVKGKAYHVFSAHPKPALNKAWHQERETYFAEIKPIIASSTLPVIVLGDFNSVPWETHFTAFLEDTNLRSTVEDTGYKMTWPVYFPLLGVPMDHILLTKGIGFSDLHFGPYAGSDHFPITINLQDYRN